jgi:hypothetical protein
MKTIFKSAASMASSREGALHDFYQGLLTKGMKPENLTNPLITLGWLLMIDGNYRSAALTLLFLRG